MKNGAKKDEPRRFLGSMMVDPSWTKEEAQQIRRKAYMYFLQEGYLWEHPKRRMETPLRVVTKREDHVKLMSEFHKSPWARHRGIWTTFEKLKGKYWWPRMYKDVAHFVETCKSYQIYSNV